MIKSAQIELLTQAILLGLNDTDACEQAGIDRTWFYDKQKKDPAFAAEVSKARLRLKARNLGLIRKAAIKQWTAAAWMLERKYPEEFSLRQRWELSGPKGKPIPIATTNSASGHSKKELEQLHAKMDRILRVEKEKNEPTKIDPRSL